MSRLPPLLLVLVVSPVALAGSEDFASLAKIDFSIRQEMRIREEKAVCLLRREPAQALARAQAALKLSGVGLKVYDCYRPTWAGKKIGAGEGDPHATGGAVDATLIDLKTGQDIAMPSVYDEIAGGPTETRGEVTGGRSRAAVAKKHAKRLQAALAKEGFQSPTPARWWHFTWKDSGGWEPQDFPYAAVK